MLGEDSMGSIFPAASGPVWSVVYQWFHLVISFFLFIFLFECVRVILIYLYFYFFGIVPAQYDVAP